MTKPLQEMSSWNPSAHSRTPEEEDASWQATRQVAGQVTQMVGDEDDSGGAPLDMNTVYSVYARYGGQLGGCLASNGARSAQISIIIEGKSGRVNWVRVNGESAGGLHGCLSRVLKSMKFPSIDGPRTRAEFDISL